jgi:hypothetical protein
VKRTRPILAPLLWFSLLLNGNLLVAAPEHDTGWFQEGCTGAEFRITKIHHTPGKLIIFLLHTGDSTSWQFMVGPVAALLPRKEEGHDTNNDTNVSGQQSANPQVVEINGRPVGTRTPDLYRVKVAL